MGDKQGEEGEGEVVEQVHGRGWDQHVHVHDHHGQVWQGAQKGGAEEAEMDKVVIIVNLGLGENLKLSRLPQVFYF